jgi:hypothetical protein
MLTLISPIVPPPPYAEQINVDQLAGRDSGCACFTQEANQ